MAKKPESDPTEDPEFQKVVSHFLKTPPKPHDGSKRKPDKRDGSKKGPPK